MRLGRILKGGGEGFEFWREDCGETWDRPFGLNPGSGVFLDDSKRLQPGQKYIRVEPFNSWVYPRTFQPGTATFNYTLGLPFLKTTNDARKAIFNLSMQARNWPTSREQMKKLADGGIQIIRLHDDNTFITPSWRDCYYPPYDEENMKMSQLQTVERNTSALAQSSRLRRPEISLPRPRKARSLRKRCYRHRI